MEKDSTNEKPKDTSKKKSVKKQKPLTPADIMKYEIAAELGLMDKVEQSGWKSLTSRESGKIGGMMTKRTRTMEKEGKILSEMKVEEIWLD